MADLSAEIEQAAQDPKKAKIGGEEVEAHSLADLIEADKYLASKAAGSSPMRGLNLRKISHPGGVS